MKNTVIWQWEDIPGKGNSYCRGPRARVTGGRWARGEQFKGAGEVARVVEGLVGQGKDENRCKALDSFKQRNLKSSPILLWERFIGSQK